MLKTIREATRGRRLVLAVGVAGMLLSADQGRWVGVAVVAVVAALVLEVQRRMPGLRTRSEWSSRRRLRRALAPHAPGARLVDGYDEVALKLNRMLWFPPMWEIERFGLGTIDEAEGDFERGYRFSSFAYDRFVLSGSALTKGSFVEPVELDEENDQIVKPKLPPQRRDFRWWMFHLGPHGVRAATTAEALELAAQIERGQPEGTIEPEDMAEVD